MKTDKANKIIAEFMGDIYCEQGVRKSNVYSESLDSLVPVWEELQTQVHYSVIKDITNVIARSLIDQTFDIKTDACIATALCISGSKK